MPDGSTTGTLHLHHWHRYNKSMMNTQNTNLLNIFQEQDLQQATLLLAFEGWMDGGDVSTGTVQRLVDILDAKPIAEIDPEPFYIYNFPGSMEMTALFRPHIDIEEGRVNSITMPSNTFYSYPEHNLVLFVGKEPNLLWRTFGECIFEFTKRMNISRIIFVGSFGGSVPHTRQPRLYVACSQSEMLPDMEIYGLRRTTYEGPGSFTSYLMTRATQAEIPMISIVAEIPGYLQGTNPSSIEAVSRRLAKILQLPMDLESLRNASTDWELEVSKAIDENEEMAQTVRHLEEEYDNELLEMENDSI